MEDGPYDFKTGRSSREIQAEFYAMHASRVLDDSGDQVCCGVASGRSCEPVSTEQ